MRRRENPVTGDNARWSAHPSLHATNASDLPVARFMRPSRDRGTNCALSTRRPQKHRVGVDTVVIATDNETGPDYVHPAQTLRAYRNARGIPAKLLVVGMTSPGSASLIPTTRA